MNTRHWFVAALAIIVAVSLLSWALSTLHENRVSEGFFQPNLEQKLVDFVNSLKQAESFTNGSLTPPASIQQQRKTSAYLANGIAHFFSTNTVADIQAAQARYLVFFQPTQSDLQCDFTNIKSPSSCASPLDSISANDVSIPIASSIRSTSDYAVGASVSLDTRIFVLGSVYNLSRISINVRCLAAPSSIPSKAGAPSVILALPTKDYTTRLIMLLRPTYIRAASMGAAASMLYWVDWSELDGEIYESEKAVPPSASPNGTWNTLIRLVQVAGFDNGVLDPVSRPAIDVAINGGRRVSPVNNTSLRSAQISTGTTSSFVLYYPKYLMPTPFGNDPNSNPANVATIYATLVTGGFATLADAYGKVVISVSCPAGPNSMVTVSVPAAGKTTFSVRIPPGAPAYVVACASYDVVTVALVTSQGTTVARQQLVKPLEYFPGKALYTYGGGSTQVKVGTYSSTSIPNYAEIAILLNCLSISPSQPLSGFTTESFTSSMEIQKNVLNQGESLLPGQSIVSQNGSYSAIYQLNGNLGVYRAGDNVRLWDSSTKASLPSGAVAGKCTLGSDGILRLIAGGTQSLVNKPYWTSESPERGAPGADQAPFSLRVTDEGKLHITGRFSASPVWSSGSTVHF